MGYEDRHVFDTVSNEIHFEEICIKNFFLFVQSNAEKMGRPY